MSTGRSAPQCTSVFTLRLDPPPEILADWLRENLWTFKDLSGWQRALRAAFSLAGSTPTFEAEVEWAYAVTDSRRHDTQWEMILALENDSVLEERARLAESNHRRWPQVRPLIFLATAMRTHREEIRQQVEFMAVRCCAARYGVPTGSQAACFRKRRCYRRSPAFAICRGFINSVCRRESRDPTGAEGQRSAAPAAA